MQQRTSRATMQVRSRRGERRTIGTGLAPAKTIICRTSLEVIDQAGSMQSRHHLDCGRREEMRIAHAAASQQRLTKCDQIGSGAPQTPAGRCYRGKVLESFLALRLSLWEIDRHSA